ncbi:MAG: hypothetical protein ACP6IT_01300 [Candidatus Thorarchaeota archaeon]
MEMMHFSKASVSRAVRELQMEMPLIETVKKPSDRERYYRIGTDFVEFHTSFVERTVEDEAEPAIRLLDRVIAGVRSLEGEAEGDAVKADVQKVLSRFMRIRQAYEKYLWFMTEIQSCVHRWIERWESEHRHE